LNTGAKSPAESTRFAASVGEDGTSAILGFDHDLLQLSSYAEGSLRLVREYIQGGSNEQSRQLLARTQTETERTSFGWGLSLRQLQRKETMRGFIDCRWPTQIVLAYPFITKATTYVKDGRLIQVVAIASQSPSGGSVHWALGGKIQLVQRFFDKPVTFGSYSVRTLLEHRVLSVGNDQVPYCLDIELFIDGLPLNLQHPGGQTQDSGGQLRNFADISRHGSHNLLGLSPKILVAVFSLRDTNLKSEPEELPCPDWTEIQRFIGLSGIDRNPRDRTPLTNFLEKFTKTDQLSKMSAIISRNVEKLLSVATLSDFTQAEPRKVYLINSLVGDDSLEINYEACL
jgi:hypothetical protein